MRLLTSIVAAAILSTSMSSAWSQQVLYPLTFDGSLTGSTATGSGLLTLDLDLSTLRVEATFDNLTGTTSAAHIHCCTAEALTGNAGVASATPTFPGFPNGVTSGTYDSTFDLTDASSFNAAFVTANGGDTTSATAALKSAMDAGKAYFNIHTSTFGSGEIRAWIVPEPTGSALVLCGLLGAGLYRRGRVARS